MYLHFYFSDLIKNPETILNLHFGSILRENFRPLKLFLPVPTSLRLVFLLIKLCIHKLIVTFTVGPVVFMAVFESFEKKEKSYRDLPE